MPYVVEASYIAEFKLRVEFENGESRVVDLAPHLDGPIFEPLHDLNYFLKFQVNHDIDTVAWPNGADFSPDFLYEIGESVAEPLSAASAGRRRDRARRAGMKNRSERWPRRRLAGGGAR